MPDLRGQFLRGTSHGTSRDPNAASRYAPMGGGNTGDNVGSAQGYATSIGTNPLTITQNGDHTHAQALVPANDHHAAWGASGPLAFNTMEWTEGWTNTTSGGVHSHNVNGGDAETRPANIYLDWLIAGDDIPDAGPIGTIMPYGGDVTSINNLLALMNDGWLACVGGKLRKDSAEYAALYAVIGSIYGGDKLNFSLPDLRGYFVMGAGGQPVGTVLGTASRSSRSSPLRWVTIPIRSAAFRPRPMRSTWSPGWIWPRTTTIRPRPRSPANTAIPSPPVEIPSPDR